MGIRITEKEYRDAYLLWKEKNPNQSQVLRTEVVQLPNGSKVPLGARITTMKLIYRAMQEGKHYGNNHDLTEEQIDWWTKHGVNLGERQREKCKEEEYREAYLLWKDENPNKTHVPQSTVVIISSGKKISLGRRISIMKSIYQAMQNGEHYADCKDLTEEQIAWWRKQGVELGQKQKIHYTEEEYRDAYLIWKQRNPGVQYVSSREFVVLPNGKRIPIGLQIGRMKLIYKAMQEEKHYGNNHDLTEEQIAWWRKQGVDLGEEQKSHYTEEEYQEAYSRWKSENSKKKDIPYFTKVKISSGKEVPLGNRISIMKLIYQAMQEGKHYGTNHDLTEEQISWWEKQGVNLSKSKGINYKEEAYREAYLLWKSENSNSQKMLQSTIVTLPNGKKIGLGRRITTMKLIYQAMQEGKHYRNNRDLTEEQIAWWTKQGVELGKKQKEYYTEEEYREAYLLWKKEKSEKDQVTSTEVVLLPSGKKVPLGARITTMRLIYQAMQEGKHYNTYVDLTEEQIDWWTEHGVDLGKNRKPHCTEKEYREAYLLWKEKNPKKAQVPSNEVVPLPSGKEVSLGRRISIMKLIYQAMQEGKHYNACADLTEEQISWWMKHGVNLAERKRISYTETEYREAYLLWKEKNPKKARVPSNEVVPLPSGKEVPLGYKISIMKLVYKAMQDGRHYGNCKDLTEKQISWWTEHGVNLTERQKQHYKEEDYREAYLLWKKKNPKKGTVPRVEVVLLPNGTEVPLGKRISTMQLIYKAMQEGKKYQGNSALIEEQIAWWTEHGVNLRGRLVQNEEDLRKAYLIWKEQHKEEKRVPFTEIVKLPNGVEVALGHRISALGSIYKAMKEGKSYHGYMVLTEEQIAWWTEHGLDLETLSKTTFSEEDYREAYLLWKEQNPEKEDIERTTVIELPNGKKVPLGNRIGTIKKIIYDVTQEGKPYPNYLPEEQIAWWRKQKINLTKKLVCSEAEYREAYLLWKKQNPREENVPQSTVVPLSNGKEIPLGTRVSIMRLIYHAMQEGKHHSQYKDLTEEEISWWTEQGLSLERTTKKWKVENVLTEFNIDFEEFIRSIESAKKLDETVELSENMKDATLKSFCEKGGYNYDTVLKASKLHKILPNGTLEQLISKIMIANSDKNKISSWVYDTYGIETIGILLELNLDAKQILTEMSKEVIPLEEAICNRIFSRLCKKRDRSFLRGFYKSVIKKINFQKTEEENAEMIVQEIMKISERNQLTETERTVLKNCLFEYLRVLRKYQIMDVSLETDSDKKQQKIRAYNLTEEEIARTKKESNEVNTSFQKMVY